MASKYDECGVGECAMRRSARKVALACSRRERYCWISDVKVFSMGVNDDDDVGHDDDVEDGSVSRVVSLLLLGGILCMI